jgi:hypothetical protein
MSANAACFCWRPIGGTHRACWSSQYGTSCTTKRDGDDVFVRRTGFGDLAVLDSWLALNFHEGNAMTLGTLLLIIVALLLIGAIPTWPYNRGWGYAPSGVAGVMLVVVVMLLAAGRI